MDCGVSRYYLGLCLESRAALLIMGVPPLPYALLAGGQGSSG